MGKLYLLLHCCCADTEAGGRGRDAHQVELDNGRSADGRRLAALAQTLPQSTSQSVITAPITPVTLSYFQAAWNSDVNRTTQLKTNAKTGDGNNVKGEVLPYLVPLQNM